MTTTDHPSIAAILDGAKPDDVANSYLQEIASWEYGDRFLQALEENLSATRHLFEEDGNSRKHFSSPARGDLLQVLGEVWIAAHFARHGFNLRREDGRSYRTPDFHFVHPATGVQGRVEVKKIDHERTASGAAARAPGEAQPSPRWGSVPSTLVDTPDFIRQACRKARDAAGQLAPGGAEVHVLALDLTGNHLYERVLSLVPFEDQENTLGWVRAGLAGLSQRPAADALMCFCIGLDRPALAVLRFLPLRDDLPPPFGIIGARNLAEGEKDQAQCRET